MALIHGTNAWQQFSNSRSTSAYFDATRLSDCGFIAANYSGPIMYFPDGATDTVWIHFTIRTDTAGSYDDGNSGPFIYDASNNRLFYFEVSNGLWAPWFNADAALNGSYNTVGTGLRTYDIKIQIVNGVMNVECYQDQILKYSDSGPCVNGRTLPRKMRFSMNDSGNAWISEIIIMDTPTLGRQLHELKPTLVGTDVDWSGGFAELGDVDALTVAKSSSVGDRVSMIADAYGGAVSGAIEGVAIQSIGQTTTGSPQSLAHYIKLDGLNYDSADTPVDDVPSYIEDIWTLNPATGLAWTFAELAALEVGLKSGA